MGVRSFLKKFLKRLLGEEFYGELRDSWNEGYQQGLADPEQPAADAEEKAAPQATSTEPKSQWQPPAEWQQSKTRAENTTEAPPSPPRPPAPYRYVKEDAPKPSEQVAEAKDAPEVEMVPEDDPQGKLRVIQGNECSIPQEVGAYCWSGIKSFSDANQGTLRKTLFIRKNADGSRDLSVFLSEFDHQREEDGKYVFKALTRPLLLFKADTTVHLMSSIEEKRQAVALVEGADDPSACLSCETHEVTEIADINYIDKAGNYTTRRITTEEIFDYEDGVFVVRAYCHIREDYRTFVSKRIQSWFAVDLSDPSKESGTEIPLEELRSHLIVEAEKDLFNIAQNMYSCALSHAYVIAHTIATFVPRSAEERVTRYKNTYYTLTTKWRNDLADYLMEYDYTNLDWRFDYSTVQVIERKAGKESYKNIDLADAVASLNAEESVIVRDALIGILKTETTDLNAGFQKMDAKRTSLSKRRKLVRFVEKILENQTCAPSAVQVLTDELLDPSFVINPFTKGEAKKAFQQRIEAEKSKESKPADSVPAPTPEKTTGEDDSSFKEQGQEILKELLIQRRADIEDNLNEMRRVSKDADIIWQKSRKKRSKTSLRKNKEGHEAQSLNFIRRITIEECETRLMENFSNNVMVFEREKFEVGIRKSICSLLTDSEIRNSGDMLLPLIGNGIRFGYLRFGLKKKNGAWYKDADGVTWIDLSKRAVEE